MATKNKCYVVLGIKEYASVRVGDQIIDLPFSQIADGCIGVLLVFKNEKSAKKYANGLFEIMEMERYPRYNSEENRDR